jgi:hypothetical protein
MIPPRTTFHPIDAYVGKRIWFRRNMSSISQTKLDDVVGLTFQKIQKYERVKIALVPVDCLNLVKY